MGRTGPPGRRGQTGSVGEDGPKVRDSKIFNCANVTAHICRVMMDLQEMLELEEVMEMP